MPWNQFSFRSIILTRLLLVSVPILLMGVYITYRKARSAFLETARQNLTESAVRNGESMERLIKALKTNLATASDHVIFTLDESKDQQPFLEQLANTFSSEINCVQLVELPTNQLINSTCNKQIIYPVPFADWPTQKKQILTNSSSVYIQKLPTPDENKSTSISQLNLLFSVPVYDQKNQLKYSLSIKTSLINREKMAPGSLTGYPVVISQNGVILAHPLPQRIGLNITQEEDYKRLKSLINSAIEGRRDFLHLFSFEKDGVEIVAGYSSIPSPLTSDKNQKWIVLAVSPLDYALAPLRDIKNVLANMVLTLLIGNILAILYIARELSRPIEKLRDYALNKDNIHSQDPIPRNFYIKELDQLATSLDDMLESLKTWGDEVVSSWREAQNANQLKNEFLATTSHELRTPLNGIIGCLRIIKDGYCDDLEEEKELLQQADNAAVHLLGIINDILDIAKIESGKLSIHPEPIELKKLLTEVVNLQLVHIQKKRIILNLSNWQPNIMIYGDAAKLKQVLLNVLSNAIKFTEVGSITISTVADDSMAFITIKDTGIGIEPSQQHKLFRPFVMIDGSTTRKFGGTGLGLAISKNLISLMGGDITLFSPGLGKGTTVEIIIPLAESSLIIKDSESQYDPSLSIPH
ncbi:two-component sensor histidine kinase [Aphanothece hegewaldii CCALA 016]|uniref:Circadian input-output histidine kinase CikA n=2 Tax=Aphanothece TaxID=1121 RepID=A0A2T1LTQ1_9CHRO|nr:two-component sensor histidine kinase [Aphanothece hegewaldii CCALA 016]